MNIINILCNIEILPELFWSKQLIIVLVEKKTTTKQENKQTKKKSIT